MNSKTTETSQPLSLVTSRQDRLRRYAYAGAGAAVLAGAVTTADAGIVFVDYNDVIIADTVPDNQSSEFFAFDMNNDAVVDFSFRQRIDSSIGDLAGILGAFPGGVIDVIGQSFSNFLYPSRLASSFIVGPNGPFISVSSSGLGSMAVGNGFPNSQWVSTNGASGFLGISFEIGGQTHYGWIKLTVLGSTDTQPFAFQIDSIAYEDTPDTAIHTGSIPEPATLGLLALGAVGLIAHRRRAAKKAA